MRHWLIILLALLAGVVEHGTLAEDVRPTELNPTEAAKPSVQAKTKTEEVNSELETAKVVNPDDQTDEDNSDDTDYDNSPVASDNDDVPDDSSGVDVFNDNSATEDEALKPEYPAEERGVNQTPKEKPGEEPIVQTIAGTQSPIWKEDSKTSKLPDPKMASTPKNVGEDEGRVDKAKAWNIAVDAINSLLSLAELIIVSVSDTFGWIFGTFGFVIDVAVVIFKLNPFMWLVTGLVLAVPTTRNFFVQAFRAAAGPPAAVGPAVPAAGGAPPAAAAPGVAGPAAPGIGAAQIMQSLPQDTLPIALIPVDAMSKLLLGFGLNDVRYAFSTPSSRSLLASIRRCLAKFALIRSFLFQLPAMLALTCVYLSFQYPPNRHNDFVLAFFAAKALGIAVAWIFAGKSALEGVAGFTARTKGRQSLGIVMRVAIFADILVVMLSIYLQETSRTINSRMMAVTELNEARKSRILSDFNLGFVFRNPISYALGAMTLIVALAAFSPILGGIRRSLSILGQAARIELRASAIVPPAALQPLCDVLAWKSESGAKYRAMFLNGELTAKQMVSLIWCSITSCRVHSKDELTKMSGGYHVATGLLGLNNTPASRNHLSASIVEAAVLALVFEGSITPALSLVRWKSDLNELIQSLVADLYFSGNTSATIAAESRRTSTIELWSVLATAMTTSMPGSIEDPAGNPGDPTSNNRFLQGSWLGDIMLKCSLHKSPTDVFAAMPNVFWNFPFNDFTSTLFMVQGILAVDGTSLDGYATTAAANTFFAWDGTRMNPVTATAQVPWLGSLALPAGATAHPLGVVLAHSSNVGLGLGTQPELDAYAVAHARTLVKAAATIAQPMTTMAPTPGEVYTTAPPWLLAEIQAKSIFPVTMFPPPIPHNPATFTGKICVLNVLLRSEQIIVR